MIYSFLSRAWLAFYVNALQYLVLPCYTYLLLVIKVVLQVRQGLVLLAAVNVSIGHFNRYLSESLRQI